MKIMIEMIRYQYKQYMLSAKWVMPLAALLCILGTMYNVAPVEIVNSFSITGLFLFGIMVWVGVTIQEVEPEVSEQVMILRLQSERKYYLSHILFLMCICVAITGISMAVPLLRHILSGNIFLARNPIWSDVAGGFLLMFACAFTGGMAGELFHGRIIRNRGIGIGLTLLVAMVAICRNGVIAKYTITKYILWVIPPVSDVVSWFTNEIYYDMGKLLGGSILLLVYGIVMAVVKVELLRKVKF